MTGQRVLLAGVSESHQNVGDGIGGGGGLALLQPLENVKYVGHVGSFVCRKIFNI